MTSKPFGICTFANIKNIISATFTLSHGITPSVCMIEMAPQRDFPAQDGTLMFIMVPGEQVTFSDCHVEQDGFQASQNGMIWNLSVLDRRWRWQFGHIDGEYNRRMPDGTIDPISEKTPRQLAKLCFDAMQEKGDPSRLPDDSRPYVDWDRDNPAKCLDKLVNDLGCRVVLALNDLIEIWPTGVGAALPSQLVLNDSFTLKPPPRPDLLRFMGGRARWEQDYELEAVGEDLDGTIKQIDKLTYKPAGGWERQTPPFYAGVEKGNARELAKKTVFRWYRIKVPFTLPKFGAVTALNQILPIEDEQISNWIDPADQRIKPKPPEIFGVIVDNSAVAGFKNTEKPKPPPGGLQVGQGVNANTAVAKRRRYERRFDVDKDRAIIKFENYVYQWKDPKIGGLLAGDYRIKPADLTVRLALSVRDEKEHWWYRYFYELWYPPPYHKTGPRMLKHDETVLNFIDGTSNEQDCQQEALYYLKAADDEYKLNDPQEREFCNIRAISPDGAIQQVTWRVGPSGATTKASRNNEYSHNVPPYRDRRAMLQVQQGLVNQLYRMQQGRAKTATENTARAW